MIVYAQAGSGIRINLKIGVTGSTRMHNDKR